MYFSHAAVLAFIAATASASAYDSLYERNADAVAQSIYSKRAAVADALALAEANPDLFAELTSRSSPNTLTARSATDFLSKREAWASALAEAEAFAYPGLDFDVSKREAVAAALAEADAEAEPFFGALISLATKIPKLVQAGKKAHSVNEQRKNHKKGRRNAAAEESDLYLRDADADAEPFLGLLTKIPQMVRMGQQAHNVHQSAQNRHGRRDAEAYAEAEAEAEAEAFEYELYSRDPEMWE